MTRRIPRVDYPPPADPVAARADGRGRHRTVGPPPGGDEPSGNRRQTLARSALVAAPLVVLGLLSAPLFRDDIGLDGLSYVSIAMQWADGHAAVNGYWGPLWSWLLVPLLAVGVDPLLAATSLQVGSAVLALLALRRLATVAGARDTTRDLLALAVTPFLVAAAHYGVFVDLLLAALLLMWCSEVLDPDYTRRPAVAVRAGLWAGLAVLTKVYALPFVLVHLVVAMLIGLHRERARPWTDPAGEPGRPHPDRPVRRVGVSAVLTLVVLGVVFLPWVAALSAHYDRFTLTKSARYNVTIAGPGSAGNPIFYAGLLAPDDPRAVSVWEDPSQLPVDAAGWEASGSDSVSRLVDNVATNLALGAQLLGDEMVVPTLLGVAGIGWALWPARRPAVRRGRYLPRPPPGGPSRPVVLGIAAAVAVYSAGYLVLFVERRYTWTVLLLLTVPAALLLQRLVGALPHGRRRPVAVAAVVVIAVAVALQSVPRAAERLGEGARAQEVADAAQAAGGIPGPVASTGFWERTAVICFELGCQYYGQPRDYDLDDLPAVLSEAGVRTYIAWGEPLAEPPGPEITPAGLANVHFYAVTPVG